MESWAASPEGEAIMEHQAVIQCSWKGVSPEDDRAIECGRPAIGYVAGRRGGRVYACEEHIGYAKELAGSGAFIHGVQRDDRAPPLAQHATTRQRQHNASVVGTME